MKCMVDSGEGTDRDAVAVCAVCGMGLCAQHLVEREVPLIQRVSGWASETAMLILCERCSRAQQMTG